MTKIIKNNTSHGDNLLKYFVEVRNSKPRVRIISQVYYLVRCKKEVPTHGCADGGVFTFLHNSLISFVIKSKLKINLVQNFVSLLD